MTKKKLLPTMKEYYLAMGEDDSTADILASSARGELVPAPNQKKLKREAEQAARNYVRKDARINIRLSSADVLMLKRRAAIEGMPYQTLIASVLHKFVHGTLGK